MNETVKEAAPLPVRSNAGLDTDGEYKNKYLSLSAQHVRETEMLLAVIEELGIKAGGGLCSMTFDGARAFLTDIKTQCEEISATFG